MELTRVQSNRLREINSWRTTGSPDLTTEFVLENYLPSWDPSYLGEFYTPLVMAKEVSNFICFSNNAKILDPCAGIGSLLYPLTKHNRFQLEAMELSLEPAQILKKLFPGIKSRQGDSPSDAAGRRQI